MALNIAETTGGSTWRMESSPHEREFLEQGEEMKNWR